MNILILWTDEQRADTLSCYGNTAIGMPNLNALARQSTVFANAYCTSPVCTPSRGSVMTGLYPHHHQATMNNLPLGQDIPTLVEHGTPHETAYIGKWHLGNEIFAQHGWNNWINVDDSYETYYSSDRDRSQRTPYHHWLISKGYEPDIERPSGPIFGREFVAHLPECHSKPRFQADEAIRLIERGRNDPWIMSVNLLEPHMPFTGPRNTQYHPDEIPVSPNFMMPPDSSCLRRTQIMAEIQANRGSAGFNPADETSIRRCLANYWGLCSQVDHHFGRILDALERVGSFDDTLIVFTSDHGDQMGSHRMIAKGVMYEESAKIPLLVKLPGQRNGRRIEASVSQVDLVPTLLEALDIEPKIKLDGTSLYDACQGGGEPDRDVALVWHVDDGHDNSNSPIPGMSALKGIDDKGAEQHLRSEHRCLVTPDRWKIVRSQFGEYECYDLDTDPYEMINLAADPAHSTKLQELDERLNNWQQRFNDPLIRGDSTGHALA